MTANSDVTITDQRGMTQSPSEDCATVCDESLSHNLHGQRLGRKGRDTRDRIIAAAHAIMARGDPAPLTLSAVAREASLGMTTLYLYFSDLTELLLAVLEPVMATAEEAYLAPVRTYWSDEELGAHCYAFLAAYNAFWLRHARILHVRNSIADRNDRRMVIHRVGGAQLLIELVVEQMGCDPRESGSAAFEMAAVLMAGIERVVTVATNADFREVIDARSHPIEEVRLRAHARLMELTIREQRSQVALVA
jgi:AcrR family transcriptional regulator